MSVKITNTLILLNVIFDWVENTLIYGREKTENLNISLEVVTIILAENIFI